MPDLIDQIKIQESIVIYKLKEFEDLKDSLNEKSIKGIFNNVSLKKTGNYLCNVAKQKETNSNEPVYYSLCVFKLSATPSFLIGRSTIREEHIAYLLIVEYGGYAVVSKKYIEGFDNLFSKYGNQVDNITIMQYRIDSETAIEKMHMRSTDMSNDQIREKIIEANNIGGTYAPINAEKNVVGQMRFRDKKEVVQVSGQSSRVSFPGKKTEYLGYFNRIINEVNKIKKYKKKPNYLDHFAEAIVFEKEIKKNSPVGALISAYELYEYINENDNVEFFTKDSSGQQKVCDINNLIGILNYTHSISATDKDNEFLLESNIPKSSLLLNCPEIEIINNLKFSILKTKLTLKSKYLKKAYVSTDGNIMTLHTLFENLKLLNVVFRPFGTVYRGGQLYKERDFYKRAELALGILRPMKGLELIDCEKFTTKNIPLTAICFENSSIFDWIETNHFGVDAEFLICDDLGNEWADYIAMKEGKYIRFIHAKNGDKSLSASQFHDVIGQALKNIGNMRASAELDQKAKNWGNSYAGRIVKLRKSPIPLSNSIETLVASYKDAIINTETAFEAWLVVNFISRKDLGAQVEKLKSKQSIEPHIVQLFSLLLRFISGCQDASVRPFIACLE